jgi:hypothetical protein
MVPSPHAPHDPQTRDSKNLSAQNIKSQSMLFVSPNLIFGYVYVYVYVCALQASGIQGYMKTVKLFSSYDQVKHGTRA